MSIRIKSLSKVLVCAECGKTTLRRGHVQKYCVECSDKKNLERGRAWARNNPPSKEYTSKQSAAQKSRITSNGLSISAGERTEWDWPVEEIGLLWVVRFHVPFSWASSKNRIYANCGKGHIALRQGVRDYRSMIAKNALEALGDRIVVQNKVWLDIMVEKPNHRGDAVNVVDSICDALKVAVGVDDRWFCIRRLDWRVSKSRDPLIWIGIGQASREAAQVCSSCGRVLDLSNFARHARNHTGRGRNCNDCRNGKKQTAASEALEAAAD